MKLLVVSQYFHPENFRINELVAHMVRSGHDVTVLTGQPNYPQGRLFDGYGFFQPREESQFGARVIRVPLVPRGKGGGVRLTLNYLSFALTASIAVWTRLQGSFDAIFVFQVSPVTVGLPAIAARRRFDAPILLWVLDLWPESVRATGAVRHPRILGLIAALVRWIFARCDAVLVQSRAFGPSTQALGVPAEHIHYFPNWIEGEYEVAPTAPLVATDDIEFRIVYAGNIGAAQDFPAIVEAADLLRHRLPQIRWIVAGDGRMAPWLREEVARRNLSERFEFLGQLPASRMPALFADADALLVSLRADPVFAMTVPGKVQSYLASGRPVLAMLDGEGARMIAESGGGLAVPAGDYAELADRIAELVDLDPAERQAIGHRGRAYAMREFERKTLFERLETLLEKAVLSYSTERGTTGKR